MAELVLVLGGMRSGKSAVAESIVAAGGGEVVYVATGLAGDAEMAERIAAHRARRPPAWETIETADPAAAVRGAPPGSAVLVDGVGMWLAARPTAPRNEVIAEVDALCATAAAHDGGPVVVVAEEAGMGVVPLGVQTRRWLDLLGEANQRLLGASSRAYLVVAGAAVPLNRGVSAGVRIPDPSRHTPVHGDRLVPEGARDFAVNVHGQAPPPHIRAVIDVALDDAGRYPDDTGARAAVAARHGRPAGEALVTAGATEAFDVLARVVHARLACVFSPSFTEPEAALRAAGIPVTHAFRLPEQGWRLDASAVDPQADVVVVGNPNNPTGTLDESEQVAALCRPGRVTIVDEAFMDFVEDADRYTLAARRDLPGLVVVRSVTKLWGLAGLRAGYLLGPPGLVARCAAARPPWATSGPALAAVEACAHDERYRRRVAREIAAQRAALVEELRALPGVTVYPGAANFLLLQVSDGPAVYSRLLARGIAVRPPTFPGLSPDHLRVAVRDDEANAGLVKALAETLAT